MKKEKLNLYILFGCLGLTVLFAILTIAQMVKSFNAVGVITLIVDIFALGVIAYCLMQEKKESDAENAQMQEMNDLEEIEEIEEVEEENN